MRGRRPACGKGCAEMTGKGTAGAALAEVVGSELARLAKAGGDGEVTIDVAAEAGEGARVLAGLEALGLSHGAVRGDMVSGRLPVSAIEALPGVAGLDFARASAALTASAGDALAQSVGAATNQGDLALKAHLLRQETGLDGTGITIGVLSDSFDRFGGALTDYADDIATGDLPSGITILDDSVSFGVKDEGRAMAQLIHDIAPGAEIIFHTAFGGIADFADGIVELAEAGADIIVDDVLYLAEPMFQDGIVARAVDEVHAMGVAYFSSAGNSARDSYESAFRGAQGTVGGVSATYHDFDDGAGTDIVQNFELGPGERLYLSFQWDEPIRDTATGSPGSAVDLDIVIVDGLGGAVASSTDSNIGADPVEIVEFQNTSSTTQTYGLAVRIKSGNAPGRIKYVDFRGGTDDAEHHTRSGASYGHASAEGGLGVGAAFYADTPTYGVSSPVLQDFSSAGGTPILFAEDGTRLAAAEERDRVDIVAPDGGDTTFFGTDNNDDGSFPNFFGTSAAAPNAAAVAALMLEAEPTATPDDIYEAMIASTIDMTRRQGGVTLPSGKDDDSGYGLFQANTVLAALAAALEETASDPTGETDLDGDAKTDLVFVDATGAQRLWLMDGVTAVVDQWLNPAGWDITFRGDLDGTGTTDLVWEDATGAHRIWLMDGVTAQVDRWLNPLGWDVQGTGDLDGNGTADLLWHDVATGAERIWLMDGVTATADVWLNPTGWEITHVADLDGNGTDDLIWEDGSGAHRLWLMDGTAATADRWINPPDWDIQETADFNGDGKADLIWRHAVTGAERLALMDGTTETDSFYFNPTGWDIEHTADLDGDGMTDLIWADGTGAHRFWLMDGGTKTADQWLNPPGWEIVTPADLNGDGKSDLVWNHAATGAERFWLMDGLTKTADQWLNPGGWDVLV